MADPSSCVFVIDDDVSVRKALTRLLRSAGYRAESYGSAGAFLDSGKSDAWPACVVADVRMPGLGGVDLQRHLLATNPVMPVVFITGHGDIPTSVEAMRGGAIDFLTKPVPKNALLNAVERALMRAKREGREYFALEEIRQLFATLTSREREVMERVVVGRLNKQIANDLGTTEKTVKVHRARVMRKMHARTLADLVRFGEKLTLRHRQIPSRPVNFGGEPHRRSTTE